MMLIEQVTGNDEFCLSMLVISEPQLLSLISDLFIAGGETTITTLRWAVLCLALYPEVQDRIRNELKETIGLDSTPRYRSTYSTSIWCFRMIQSVEDRLQLIWFIINDGISLTHFLLMEFQLQWTRRAALL